MSIEERGGRLRHPITYGQLDAWQVADDVWAWQNPETGAVTIQGVDGDVTVPAAQLALLGRGVMAAHVYAGRLRR